MAILEECYSLSINYIDDDTAKMLIRDRLNNSRKLKQCNQYQNKPNSIQETFTSALLALSEESISNLTLDVFSKQSNVNDMEECAEKNYLLALLTLRSGMDDEGRIEATKYLEKAHNQSPNDPRIRTLELILQSI